MIKLRTIGQFILKSYNPSNCCQISGANSPGKGEFSPLKNLIDNYI